MDLKDFKDFIKPSTTSYTIYSKSGCPNCKKAKDLLNSNQIPFTTIDCDEYLLETKTEFLSFIMNLTSQDWRSFPIVFNDNGDFIGGFIDTREYLEKKREQPRSLDFTDDF